MTDHPAIAAGCSKAQIEAFERIAVGDAAAHNPRTLAILQMKGLIEFERRTASDIMGAFSWNEPTVPIGLHMDWCQWCSENVKDDDL